MSFRIATQARGSRGRAGELATPHGIVPTPAFMPVGTQATVKGITPRELQEAGVAILLCNAYHLAMRPGEGLIARQGGLHRFMGWPGPILTDSGGYQVFSLARLARVADDGVDFQNPVSGSPVFFTPEKVVAIQLALGVDVLMPLDQPIAYPCEREMARVAMERTIAWAKRSLDYFRGRAMQDGVVILDSAENHPSCHSELVFRPERIRPGRTESPRPGVEEMPKQVRHDMQGGSSERSTSGGQNGNPASRPLLFGIVQGSVFPELRRECATRLLEMGFDGLAIGGLSMGEDKRAMMDVLGATLEAIPRETVVYLMGVGTPEDVSACARMGVDLFDCVLPTRNGRSGWAFTREGVLRLRNSRFADDGKPLDESCGCYVCRSFSRSYLRHLFQSDEMLGPMLVSLHNIHFYTNLTAGLRQEMA
ncbi:MAG: tRNA guanosine(34) transglycosylase Tgt [Planctomycetota bacterium]|nr:tRNA guanosine(34) transglycosylase Tgt [Planctomycetota bacterium]